jgi:hypothetical protein
MTRHYCGNGGYVGGAHVIVPDDPTDYQAGSMVSGCNNLRCTTCGQPVRHRVGVECAKVRSRLKALAETADWSTLPYVTPFPPARLYACQCTGWLEVALHACQDPDPDPTAGDPVLPWRCDGHPVATLPMEIDGVPFAEDTDYDALVTRVLGG